MRIGHGEPMEDMMGNRRLGRCCEILLVVVLLRKQCAALFCGKIDGSRGLRRMAKLHVLAIDQMRIDEELQAPAGDASIRIRRKRYPLNLLAIENVVALKRKQNEKIAIGE